MKLIRKLEILADAAKYDASCASSGAPKRTSLGGPAGAIGSTEGMGICHSYAPDGRCISLLKILLTNWCTFDCLYCVNRESSDTPRARFTVQEVVDLTLDFYRRNVIEGLFLSSGIVQTPDATMEEVIEVARRLREEHHFGGYIHLKTIPNASDDLIARAGRYADRLSINVELPTRDSLASLAPEKSAEGIRASMARIRLHLDDHAEARRARIRSMAATPAKPPAPPRFAPAGQSTQMIVGADASDDRTILAQSASLYASYRLKRVYYSAFSPIPKPSDKLPPQRAPLQREHRLYQADWLVRFYGFTHDEIVGDSGMLDLGVDPKLAWALAHPAGFPVDVNRAPRELLLRVPGLGVKSVDKLLAARRLRRLRHADLARLGAPLARIGAFVIAADHRPAGDAPGRVMQRLRERRETAQASLFALMHTVRLAAASDIAGFRAAAREHLAAGTPPQDLHFIADGDGGLFADAGDAPEATGVHRITLPAGFATLCAQAGLHDDPSRFDRLYDLAFRIARRREVWLDRLDAQRVVLERMAQAVRREIHKAHAFVRFRPVQDEHVAWFEPAHHVVEAIAPFFVGRFAGMRWAILTPRGGLRWDGARLQRGPAASPGDAPAADAGEALWLAYYRSIFNPARLMPDAMRREMPVRFWRNLPEAVQITGLIDGAGEREVGMVDAEAAPRTRKRGAAPPVAPRGCERCAFAAQATQMVPGEGAVDAALMIVGEQPGDREDLEGRPFVGPAGQLVREAIAALGWPADRLWLTNAVKHFKYELRGKRRLHKTASQLEALACLDWLEQEIASVRPRAIVALGSTAARSLLGRTVPVNEHAGRWFERSDGVPVLLTWHPAALLRGVAGSHDAWLAHLRSASAYLD